MPRYNATVRLITTEIHADSEAEALKKAEAEAEKMACACDYSVMDVEIAEAHQPA